MYFESLAIPSHSLDFDDEFLERAQEDIILIDLICATNSTIVTSTLEETTQATYRLHSNKAQNITGMTSEHINFAKHHETWNYCFANRSFQEVMKQGIVIPILKKADQKRPTNYTGITVTPFLTSLLQSALIITECIIEVQSNKHMSLATIDTQRVFDIVNLEVLLRNPLFDGITGTDWLLSARTYLLCDVFLCQMDRTPFQAFQSWSRCETWMDPVDRYVYLLLQLDDQHTGAKIGNINIPHTTYADDVALL